MQKWVRPSTTAAGRWLCGVALGCLAISSASWALAEGSTDATTVAAVQVNAKLNAARDQIQPGLGASVYTMDQAALQALPGGENASLNEVILQAPGVAQDSFGQLHVRGEHNGLQFRLNGVILPEGLSVFSQALSPRLAGKVALITGALPAQYGLRTAGIVDISTKTSFDNSGTVSLYGGSHQDIEPSVEYGFSQGPWNGFVSLSWKQNTLGIESPDASANPLHDRTEQLAGFAYLERVLNDETRLAFIFGTSVQRFQIPDLPNALPSITLTAVDLTGGSNVVGQQTTTALNVDGRTTYASSALNETQREITHYAVASLLTSRDQLTTQVSLFARYSSLNYAPDEIGDILFNGISQAAFKTDVAAGLQAEAVYRLNDSHKLRSGVILQFDRSTSRTQSEVIALQAAGASAGSQVADQPIGVPDGSASTAQTYSAYLQDEWALAQGLTLNYGLRYDLFNGARREDQLSPRLNLVWKPDRTLSVHVGYSRYFTPPPFELIAAASVQKFVNTTAAVPITIDDAPYAERADYFDIGAEKTFFKGFTVGLDTYYKRSRHLIDEGQFGAPIILTPFNYQDGLQYGEELSTTYSRGKLQIYANLAYGMARGRNIVSSQFNFTPDKLAYIANHFIYLDHEQKLTGSAGASFKVANTTLSTDLIYGSGLRREGVVPNGAALPGYPVVNFSANRSFTLSKLGTWAARVDLINAFDKVYEIRDGTGVGVGAPQYGARRALYFGLSRDI